MLSALIPEIVQDAILFLTFLSLGGLLVLAYHLWKDHRSWVAILCVGVVLITGTISVVIVGPSEDGIPLTAPSAIYLLGMLLVSIGSIGTVLDYRKGLRLGRLDRIVYTSDQHQVDDQEQERRDERR